MRKQVAVHVWMRENKVTESEDVDEHKQATEQAHSADEIGVGGTTAGWSTRSWGQRSRREGLCVHPCAVPLRGNRVRVPRERGQSCGGVKLSGIAATDGSIAMVSDSSVS